MVKICDNAFNGIKGENVFENNFLKIVEPLKIKRLSQDRFSLSVFPTSLSGAARKWFTNECLDTISTWDDLFEKFIQKLYNLSDLHKDKETSDENNPNIIDNVPEIFKIEEDMFNFDKPLCIAFKEFNYLLKIDPDLFTYDIQWIKTYDEYEQELNNEKHKGLMDNGQRMGFRINLVTIYANCTASKMELQNGRHVFWMPTDIVMDRSYPGCLPDHMDHICEEVSSLNLKLRDKESFIIHQVSAKIKSSLPVLVTTTLQEQLPGLLSATLKDYLPSILQESLQTHIPAVSERLAEKQTKLNKKVVRHLHRQFNIFHVAKTDKFARLEMELSKTLKESLLESAVIIDDTAEREKTKKAHDANLAATQGSITSDNKQSEGKELVVYNSEKKKSEGIILVEDDSDKDDKQPLSKRFKILTPIPDIPNPTPLNTFVPEHLLKSKEQQKSIQEFTDQLFKTTSLRFLPTPPKEPTPPRYSSKGKAFAIIEEPGKKIRISDLKAEKEKSEQELRKLLNPATLKAQAHKWTKHKAKKAKMMEEYNHQISYRADPLPITKISYVVNSRKEATMKITRGNNPLNLIVHPNFRLKTLGFKLGEPLSSRLRGEEDQLSAKHQLVVKGLSKCKALESNIRRIQVNDIVKEVEDYLKTYSSARMDISRIWNGLPFSKRKGRCGWQAWYSFGYGESSDDYKVVEMSSRLQDEFDRTDIIIRVQIYSAKTRNWKRLGYCSPDTGVYSNGALHWTAFENRWSSLKQRITSLDLEKEIYGEALQPEYDEGDKLNDLGVWGEWLCVLCMYFKNFDDLSVMKVDVWAMKVYGMKDSWTKLVSIPHQYLWMQHISRPLCISNDGKVLLSHRLKWFVHDCVNSSCLEIDLLKWFVHDCVNSSCLEIQNFDRYHEACIVVQSLVSPFPL
ncbi:nucleotide-binding alpha-beta plait domain-containing protein [Tanacetum coccineum]